MWNWYTLLSFKSLAEIAALKAEVEGGRNPKDAKVLLAKEITARFHSAALADAAEQDFNNRSKGRSEEHTSELQSPCNLVCRLLLEKKTGCFSILTARVSRMRSQHFDAHRRKSSR